MGGSLFRRIGISTVRLPAAQALPLAEEILPALHAIEAAADRAITPARLIPAYRNKPDYGDLDFLVSDQLITAVGDNAIRDGLAERLGLRIFARRPHPSDPTYALALHLPSGQTFQVDLISSSEADIDFAFGFLSWNDTGSYIGRVARQMGLRFGQNGLLLLMSDTDGTRVPVSMDRDAVISFLGFDAAAHRTGFDRPEDIYDFISESRYFDPAIYELDRMTNKARQRVKKRTFYPEFIESIRSRPVRHEWPAEREPGSRAIWRERVFEAFPGTREAHAAALEDFQRKSAAREFFSGARVSSITGVRGPRLEHLMNAVRRDFETHADFIHWAEKLDNVDLEKRLRKAIAEGYLPIGYSD